jgi:hypothetical protein
MIRKSGNRFSEKIMLHLKIYSFTAPVSDET